ncbi:anti-sigma factor antagonist [Kribbella turkmenica]|uniref:Anti-sigma factor antagonist n=1 Tax=Kribbella turkmenica TaxID=2530375 RepID=A0A4R4WWW6_9ACTN|nr:STAS domain-containing protein [Kribbella turkmenica]TDD22303.1 anti-sigma factor antagonist [Kribbella turkmenica]
MSDELLSLDVQDRGPDLVVTVSGELDFGTTSTFLDATRPLAKSGRPVILDLTGLAFCDSSGLGAFVRLHKQLESTGGRLTLAGPRAQLRSTLELTMLHRILHVRDDLPAPGDA